MERNMVGERTVETAATQSQAQTAGYYAIRVDARGAPLADSLYDTAEKLVADELDNARQTLERLWVIRRETQSESCAAVVDGLIAHFDANLQRLRTRQETLRKVGQRARRLLDEKQRDEVRLAQLKAELGEVERMIREYTERRDRLRTEQEALLAAAKRRLGELAANERAVVVALRESFMERPAAEAERPIAVEERETVLSSRATTVAAAPTPPHVGPDVQPRGFEQTHFAKSVVKTSTGRVLGEYYYDPAVERSKRHYVFNSRFLLEQLSLGLDMLRKNYDHENHAELVQMLQDAHARISQSPNLHYEISTQDVLNHESLVETWQKLRMRAYDDVARFCERLRDKIDTLGPSYGRLLKAQMERLLGCSVEKGKG